MPCHARARLALLAALLLGLLAPWAATRPADAAPIAHGYRDFAFAAPADPNDPNDGPTGEKPQSKLWYTPDNTWWGVLRDAASGQYRIYRFDWIAQSWSDTGTPVDARGAAHADCLWDGTHLYIATAVPPGAGGDRGIRVLRYRYTAGVYTPDAGFPVTVATAGVEAVVLDKDTTGRLWLTYTLDTAGGGRSVYVAHSAADDTVWGTPYVLPVAGATTLSGDDIAALVAYSGRVGVMWSNQTDSTVYFAAHTDGEGDAAWAGAAVLRATGVADDHLNLKSLQADASGQLFAAVKTSYGDLATAQPTDPQILVLRLDQQSGWQITPFGRISDHHTRPLLLIDQADRQLYVFATAPEYLGGAVYYKRTSLDTLAFPTGLGTPFIQSAADPVINNPTSTKQLVAPTSGLLVAASDLSTGFYLHNTLVLGPTPSPSPTPSPTPTLTPTPSPSPTLTPTPTPTPTPSPTPSQSPNPSPTPSSSPTSAPSPAVRSSPSASLPPAISPTPSASPSPSPSPMPSPSPVPTTSTFTDVPTGYWAFAAIEQVAHLGITNGCDTDVTGRRLYCPDRTVTRAEMAVFLARTLGHPTPAPPATPTFTDVPADSWAFAFIEQFAQLGITTGCGTDAAGHRLYCPDRTVTRAEMAVFIDRAKTYTNPAAPAVATFADVPAGYWAFAHVEQFYQLGVTTGCGTDAQGHRLFCPDRTVTRAEMAVFITRSLGQSPVGSQPSINSTLAIWQRRIQWHKANGV